MKDDITTRFTRLLIYDDLEFDPNQVVSVFSEIGIENWLAEHPFEKIEFLRSLKHENREVYALYSYKTHELAVATTRPGARYNVEFRWGAILQISDTARHRLEGIKMTLVHELGHHLHAHLRKVDIARFRQTMLIPYTNGVSQYARQPSEEYFAECFAAWVFYRTEFIIRDELGYGMIERALESLKVEVAEL